MQPDQAVPDATYPEEPLTAEELALAEYFRHLDCGQVVDPVDLEDCGGMAVEILRFLSARGWREPELQAQPEHTGRGRFEELLAADHLTADSDRLAPAQQPEAVPEARAVPIEDLIEEISAADPEFRAAVERTERDRLTRERDEWKHRATELQPAAIHERESLRSENTRLRDLVRRYEGTGSDSKLTYAELEQERDRLAVDLYRAQDCGHDLEAFGRQTDELRDKRNDLLNIRGLLSPNGYPRVVPMDLGETVAPAVEWLIGDRDRLVTELAETQAERDRLGDKANELVQTLTATRNNRLVSAIFGHHKDAPRPFALYRRSDVTGVSGTGIVAEGAAFSDGTAVLRWLSDWPTSVVFHDRGIEAIEAVHGHGGATQIVWLSDELEPLAEMEAERDRMAATIRRYGPVIEAAKAWRAMRLGTPTQPKPEALALIQAVDALDASPGDTESGQRGRDEGTTTPEETNDGR